MHGRTMLVGLVATSLILVGCIAMAQQGTHTAAPAERGEDTPPALLVLSDLPCSWTLDGVAKGKIQADASVNAEAAPGPHSIQAIGEDGLDTLKVDFTIEPGSQKVVLLQFVPARAVRLNAEIEARQQRLRDEAARLAPTPAERFKEAVAHFERREYAQAKPLLSGACSGGNTDGCIYLARIYGDPLGGNYDKYLATSLFSRACDLGNADGCVGFRAMSPPQTPPVVAPTLPAEVQASTATVQTLPVQPQNPSPAMQTASAAAVTQAEHLIVKKQFGEAKKLLEEPCKERNAKACYMLGKIYEIGRGVAQDSVTARAYYVRACDYGNSNGCDRVGQLDVNSGDSVRAPFFGR